MATPSSLHQAAWAHVLSVSTAPLPIGHPRSPVCPSAHLQPPVYGGHTQMASMLSRPLCSTDIATQLLADSPRASSHTLDPRGRPQSGSRTELKVRSTETPRPGGNSSSTRESLIRAVSSSGATCSLCRVDLLEHRNSDTNVCKDPGPGGLLHTPCQPPPALHLTARTHAGLSPSGLFPVPSAHPQSLPQPGELQSPKAHP